VVVAVAASGTAPEPESGSESGVGARRGGPVSMAGVAAEAASSTNLRLDLDRRSREVALEVDRDLLGAGLVEGRLGGEDPVSGLGNRRSGRRSRKVSLRPSTSAGQREAREAAGVGDPLAGRLVVEHRLRVDRRRPLARTVRGRARTPTADSWMSIQPGGVAQPRCGKGVAAGRRPAQADDAIAADTAVQARGSRRRRGS